MGSELTEATRKALVIDRKKLCTRLGALIAERSSWMEHWKLLSSFFLPYSGRFFSQDRNRGGRRFNSIYDSSGVRASRTLGAGMMAGATSPARPWFRLLTPDKELNTYYPVKVWLTDVAELMQRVFQKSNTYRSLHSNYEELGVFGTGASICLPNYNNIIHHYNLTIGEYCLARNMEGVITTLYREFEQTVGAIVKEFGRDKCSIAIKNLYDRGNLDSWVPIIHVVEPREDRDVRKLDSKNMEWGSYYFERGGNEDQFLRESGFKYFPVLAPRWAVQGGDVYGNGPGMEALGDNRQLQHEQLRKGQCIDNETNPALQVPSVLKNREVDRLPGGITYYDSPTPGGGVSRLFKGDLKLDHLLMDIKDVRERINSAFFVDLFLMLATADLGRMTATEVAERHEEKLLMLGPVLERLHNELLDPLIETTFSRLIETDVLPLPPPELQGVDINVEFVSMLAQAQRAIGTNSVDRWMGNVGAIAQFKPDVLDKIDTDFWADEYANMLGIDPRFIIANDKVAVIREEKAAKIMQAQQAEAAEKQAKALSNLSNADMSQNNALTNVMDQFSGYNTPGVMR